METFISMIAIALGVALIVLMVICLKKDKSLVGFYKATNICGRAYAFFTADFLLTGAFTCPVGIIMSVILAANSKKKINLFSMIMTFVIVAIIALALGIFMYRNAARKCSPELKRRLLRDMFIIMFATAIRVWLFILRFFIATWFEANKPTPYYLPTGETVYALPWSNELYSASGYFVGHLNNDGTITVGNKMYERYEVR